MVRGQNVSFKEETLPGLKDAGDVSSHTDIFNVSNHRPTSNNTPKPVPSPIPSSVSHTTKNAVTSKPSKAPNDISSQISTDNILSVDRRGNSIIVYLTKNVECDTPKTYLQAFNSPNSSFWKKAIQKEVSNMYDHNLWAIVKKSGEQSRINCTWVFKVKKDQLNVPIE